MDKRDLKLTGIIAAILTFAFLGAWFGFSKLSLGIDYNPTNWPKGIFKKDSAFDSNCIILNGTSGAQIVFGTTTNAWVGTPTDSTLARIGLNTGTGRIEIKDAGSTSAYYPGTLSVSYLNTNYISKVGGTGTDNIFSNTTLAGQGTITATMNVNGVNISPTELAYAADGASSNLQMQITTVSNNLATEQAELRWIAGNYQGTSTLTVRTGGGISVNVQSDIYGSATLTFDTTGSASAKADIKEGGTVTVSEATFTNYNNDDFNVSVNGSGADIDLSSQKKGTTTPTAGYTAIYNSSNLINGSVIVGLAYGSITTQMQPTATIPFDNTVPQNSEGTEILTLSYTPKGLGNKLMVEGFMLGGSNDNSNATVAALFKDSATNAVAVGAHAFANGMSGTALIAITFCYVEDVATTTTSTWKIRGGCNTAKLILPGLNNGAPAYFWGGTIPHTTLKITEYLP